MTFDGRVEQFSRTLSRRRRARWLHPVGTGFHATLEVAAGNHTETALFDRPGTYPAIVRHSRATGTPEPLPDAYGLAVRLPDLHGRGRHQDFLVTTSIDAPVLHHLPLPAPGGPWSQSYSSALPYRVGSRTFLVGAVPRDGGRTFDLALAPLLGRWRPIARLRLGDPLDPQESDRLRFDVWNTGGGIAPIGAIQRLRRPIYRGSQRGRAEALRR
jgi:hypothetical protein